MTTSIATASALAALTLFMVVSLLTISAPTSAEHVTAEQVPTAAHATLNG